MNGVMRFSCLCRRALKMIAREKRTYLTCVLSYLKEKKKIRKWSNILFNENVLKIKRDDRKYFSKVSEG